MITLAAANDAADAEDDAIAAGMPSLRVIYGEEINLWIALQAWRVSWASWAVEQQEVFLPRQPAQPRARTRAISSPVR
jgi:4-hydroxybenzoate polyprenyltransferase